MTFTLRNFHTADLIKTGQCVLTRRDPRPFVTLRPNILDYWLAVVCTRSMLPVSTLQAKPTLGATAQNGPFPVWLIGKSEFLWVSRVQIYHFTEAHNEAYRQADPTSDFMTYFTLANDHNGNLLFWRDVILEHKKQIDAQDTTPTPRGGHGQKDLRKRVIDLDHSSDPNYEYIESTSDDSHLEDSEYEDPARRKRARISSSSTAPNPYSNPSSTDGKALPVRMRLIAPSPPPFMLGPVTPPTPISAPSSTTPSSEQPGSGSGSGSIFIKPEPSENHPLPAAEQALVDVFVSSTNTKFSVSRTALLQSAFLTTRITTRPSSSENQQRPFIMDPTLTPLSPSDFSAVIEFLNAGEYEPVLLLQEPPASFPSSSASTSHSQEKSEYILDDSTSPIDYSKELIRSARLINLAKKFQLPAFAACVFRKVLFGHPDNKYDIKAFLEFARIVLGNQVQDQDLLSAHTDTAPPPGEAQAKDTKPSIFHTVSSWTITFLAENMEAITCSLDRRDVSGFWGVMKLGRGDRWVEKRVLEVRLEIGRKWPGGRVKVEGD